MHPWLRICIVVVVGIVMLPVAVGARSPGAWSGAEASPLRAATTEVIVHYHRFDGDYTDWNLWLWPFKPNNEAGASYPFTARDDYGVVADAQVPGSNTQVGIIVRLGDWKAKDVQQDRFVDTPSGKAEVWLIQGDPTIYTSLAAAQAAVAEAAKPKLVNAYLDDATSAYVQLTRPITLAPGTNGVTVTDTTQKQDLALASVGNGKVLRAVNNPNAQVATDLVKVTLAGPADVTHAIQISFPGVGSVPLIPRLVLNDPKYYYGGDDMGAVYSRSSTSFRVWAPTASAVRLLVYKNEGGDVYRSLAMDRSDGGTWLAKVSGNLDRMFYVYQVTTHGDTQTAVDPYARGISVNGAWGMIVDLARTNPSGWSADRYIPTRRPTDAVIYEVHVRDFSIDARSGMRHRGKFLAFTERGTKGPGGVPTGVDSIKQLGVTHVEIMPSFEFASVDETRSDVQYNWGYDPQDYNVPEGAYATNIHGTARITQFKQMVQALHRRGLAVIMDVVYPHTAKTGASDFDKIVPQYYYRTDYSGHYTNGSGVGDEVAAERPMVRKFILDSVKYWMRQYHVDGYRFDQLYLLGKETTTQISRALHAINPHTVLLGEPWGSADSGIIGDQQLTKGVQKGLRVGVFNDELRDWLDGSVFDRKAQGFATGKPSALGKNTALAMRSISGNIAYSSAVSGFSQLPEETINYVTSHDNMTLWDKITASNPAASEADRIKMDELAQAVVMTSQGVPFMQGGEEMLRTKKGNDNSYNAGDEINQFYWARKAQYRSVFAYYGGLIHLRDRHPAFRMNAPQDIKDHLKFYGTPNNTFAFELVNHANGDRWNNITVIYNPNSSATNVPLPGGAWHIVAQGSRIGEKTLGHATGAAAVPPLSMMVLYGGSAETPAGSTPTTPKPVDVTFKVRVPASTPAGDTVFISGNIGALGPWDPAKQPMTNAGGGIWTVTLSIPDGTDLQYKYTRGSWAKVESWGKITGLANRSVTISGGPDGKQVVDDTATDWGAAGPDDHRGVQHWADIP